MVSIAMAIVVLLVSEYNMVDQEVQPRAGVCYNALSKQAFRMTPRWGIRRKDSACDWWAATYRDPPDTTHMKVPDS